MTTRSLKVEIAGIAMSVKTDASEDDVKQLAQLVEERLRELAPSGTAAPSPQALLLTAMTFAEDYRETQRKLRDLQDSTESELNTMREALRRANDDAETASDDSAQ